VQLIKERIQFESEIIEKGNYLFETPSAWDQQIIDKKWKPDYLLFFDSLTTALAALTSFDIADIDTTIKTTAASYQIKAGEIMQLLRVFISGQGTGVDLLGMMNLLGKDEVIVRLNNALEMLRKK